MSLAIWAKGGLVLLVGGGISGAIVGFTKLSPSTYSGSGVATRPRLVIARGKGAHAELSFNYDSFFGGGYKEGQLVPFNKVEMKFGNYQLKDGDLLCSPDQDGKYFVMQKTAGGTKQFPEYKIDGHNQKVTKCPVRGFLNREGKNVKTITLQGFRPQDSTPGSSVSVSTIYVSNCSFTLKKKTGGNNVGSIVAEGCTTKNNRGVLGSNVETFPIIPEYEVN